MKEGKRNAVTQLASYFALLITVADYLATAMGRGKGFFWFIVHDGGEGMVGGA